MSKPVSIDAPAHVIARVEAFAAENGRLWRSKLRALWQAGTDTGALREARNYIGPSGLDRFKPGCVVSSMPDPEPVAAPPAAPVVPDPVPADVPCYLAVSTDGAGVETVMGVFRVAEHASPQAAEAEASKLCDRIRAAAPGSICRSRYSEGASEADIARAVSGGWRLQTGAGEPPTSWRRIRDGLLDRVPTAADACRMMDRETAMVSQVAQQQQANAGGLPKVWKESKREYYSRTLSRPNRNGSMQTACSRLVVSWCARIDGRVVRGFGTRRAAIAALNEAAPAMVPQPGQPQQGRDMRRGMARCEVPGEWQIGIWCVTRQPGGTWEARATGPGTIGDGSPHSYPTLAAAYLGLTGEPMPGASRE